MGIITRAGAFLISILLVGGAVAIRSELRDDRSTHVRMAEPVSLRAAEPVSLRGSEPEQPEPAEPIVVGADPDCALLVGPNGWDEGEGDAWTDHLAEDGTIDYANGTWTITHWDGQVEAVGWSLAEDSAVWNGPTCGDLTWGYAG